MSKPTITDKRPARRAHTVGSMQPGEAFERNGEFYIKMQPATAAAFPPAAAGHQLTPRDYEVFRVMDSVVHRLEDGGVNPVDMEIIIT